jgi:hypothetical protein
MVEYPTSLAGDCHRPQNLTCGCNSLHFDRAGSVLSRSRLHLRGLIFIVMRLRLGSNRTRCHGHGWAHISRVPGRHGYRYNCVPVYPKRLGKNFGQLPSPMDHLTYSTDDKVEPTCMLAPVLFSPGNPKPENDYAVNNFRRADPWEPGNYPS